MAHRKIIHIDADSFYASVEMRENPDLRDRALAVGGRADRRGVIATCNYEARKFDVHSAMSAARAKRLCPRAVFLPSRIDYYAEVSRQIQEIFFRFTPLGLAMRAAAAEPRQALEHGFASLRIEAGDDLPLGLVVDDGAACDRLETSGADRPAIDTHPVGRADALPQLGRSPVHLHPAVTYPLLDLPSRTESRTGQHLL